MDGWEKARVVSGIVATVLIPVAVGFVGHEYSRATKEREIGAKYVELAVGILRSPPSDDQYDVRAWAVEVVDRHSGVKLTDHQKEHLKRTGVLEEVAVTTSDPAAGSAAPPSASPTGPEPAEPRGVTVPNVRGLTVSEATAMFRSAGLRTDFGNQPDTAIVNAQNPPAGSRVPTGSSARITAAERALVPRSRLSTVLPRN